MTELSPAVVKKEEDSWDTGGIGGHPKGLTVLFFTELWERFSYYGMRAILILYMVAPLADGGLAFSTRRAATVYGTYTMAVYLLALPGGLLADKWLGARLAVLLGGLIIAAGHFTMTFSPLLAFYLGLVLIALGTGLLKPNISTMVGSLYRPNDRRRDSGFSLFFMGINVGAALAPLVCGYLAQSEGFRNLLASNGFDPSKSWHWGFGAAGIGMVIGLVWFLVNQQYVAPAARASPSFQGDGRSPLSTPLTKGERRRIGAIFIFFFFTVIFGTVSEQAGSSMNLFADRLTRTEIFGWEFPSSWFQSVIPIYVILLAPLFSVLWLRLGDRQPSTPIKFSLALLFLGLAFLLMVPAWQATTGGRVSPWWLLSVFFLQEIGAVILNPVGLSTVTKLAPARLVGVMMGVWFLASAVASKTAGFFAGFFDETKPSLMMILFGSLGLAVVVSAGVLALLSPWVGRLMGRVR